MSPSGVLSCLFLLADRGYQVLRTLTRPQVNVYMPEVDMEPVFGGIKAQCKDIEQNQNLKVSKFVGGTSHMIIDLKYQVIQLCNNCSVGRGGISRSGVGILSK